jgi:hypothetical protein
MDPRPARLHEGPGPGRCGSAPESVAEWLAVVEAKADGLLANEIDSWMTGVNMNVEGKQTRTVVRYSGTAPEYRAKCDEVAAGGYRELSFHKQADK